MSRHPTARFGGQALLADQRVRRGLYRPAAMTVLAVVFGAGLMAFAGWFIAASAVAGLAVASTFSFVYPSAGVQAVAWARTASRYGERITTHKATLDLVGSLRTSLFAGALRLPRDRVAALRSSELLGRITVDSDAVDSLLLRSWFPILAAVAAPVGMIAMFAVLSLPVAIVGALGLLVSAAFAMLLARHEVGGPAREFVDARAQARRALIEALDGLPELRSFGAERRAAAVIRGELERLGHSRRRLTRLEAGGNSLGSLLTDLTLAAIVGTAAGAFAATALSAPSFVPVCLVALTAFEAIVALPGAVTARARARAAADRLAKVFPPDGAVAAPAGADFPWPAAIEIRLDRENVELELVEGDTVLISGASGTGKSTLLGAMTGRPAAGVEVRVGGIDVAEVDAAALRAHVTLVAQDAYVFDGTIRENLALADPSADELRLRSVMAAVALDDTLCEFPAGLDTAVGPGGTALSGGQRRRLSVAQGLLRRADVLLLDEPTEGLDTATASRLLSGVREFDPATVLVIALHDRQSPPVPWQPDAHIQLTSRLVRC